MVGNFMKKHEKQEGKGDAGGLPVVEGCP